jgi:hypothetical protein
VKGKLGRKKKTLSELENENADVVFIPETYLTD